MARYHIKKDGTPGICHAQPGNCPLGGEGEHYPSMEAAQAAADSQNAHEYSNQSTHKTLTEKQWNDFMEEADMELDVPVARALFLLPTGHLMGDPDYTGSRFTDHNVVYTDPMFTGDDENKSDLDINREFQMVRVVPEGDPVMFLTSKGQELTSDQQEFLNDNGFETTVYG